jgi:cytochrome b561
MRRDSASALRAAKAAPRRWSAATIALHWLSAALILGLIGLGWFMVHGDIDAATKFDLYQLHKSLGFLGLALLLLRLGARLVQASPPAPPAMPPWEHRLAGLAHAGFYGLLLAASLTGWLLVSAAVIAIPTRFFDLFVIPNLLPSLTRADASLSAAMAFWHYVIARLILGLLVLHVAAALKHHFVDRNDVLTRMLPWPTRLRAAPSNRREDRLERNKVGPPSY